MKEKQKRYDELSILYDFRRKCEFCNSCEEINVLMYQIKSYLNNNEELWRIYNKKKLEFNKNKFKQIFTRYIKYISEKPFHHCTNINLKFFGFFPNFPFKSDDCSGFECLYRVPTFVFDESDENITSLIDKTKNMRSHAFAIYLEKNKYSINVYMFSNDYNNLLYQINKDFYLKYLKAITNGTLQYLIRTITIDTYENHLEYDISKKQMFEKINISKNSEELIQILKFIINNKNCKLIEMETELNKIPNVAISSDTIKNRLREIVKICNCKSGELGQVKKIVQDYHLKISDFDNF